MDARTSKVLMDTLEGDITCPICRGRFVSPKVLPCGHYCCARCLQELAAGGSGSEPAPFACPACGKATTLPGNDVERLQSAPFVERLIETIENSANHQQQQQLQQTSSGAGSASPPDPRCVEHELQAKMFCFSCNQLVCSECVLYLHRGHPYEKIVTASQKCVETLRQRAEATRELREGIMFALSQVDRRREEVADLADNVGRSVKKTFDDMGKALQRRREQLFAELATLTKHKLDRLDEQKRTLAAAVGGADDLIASCQRVRLLPDVGVVTAYRKLVSEAAGHRERCAGLVTEPSEAANVGVQLWSPDSFEETVLSQTGVYLSDAYGPGLARAEVGKRAACFTVRPVTPLLLNPTITSTLTSLVDDSVVPVTVVSKQGTAVYEASYHPLVRGRHRLTVEINGAPIGGNPFPVYATVPPSQLKRLERSVVGVMGVLHLAFNGRGQMLVTELGGNVVTVRSKQGRKAFQLAGRQLIRPWGVALDEEDNAYVSEEGAQCVSKFTAEGKFIRSSSSSSSVGGVQLDGPRGLKVIGDKVYVCDGNNRCVKVLSRDLELVKSLFFETGKIPTDLVASPNGLLYVSLSESRAVEVYSLATGARRYSVEHEEMVQPSGLAFDPHQMLLYAADASSANVFVFRHNGEFVCKFSPRNGGGGGGTDGAAGAQLWGVAIDEDGFVYLCDARNSRILVY